MTNVNSTTISTIPNPVQFLSRSGIISGFDMSNNAVIATITETFLAAYARADTLHGETPTLFGVGNTIDKDSALFGSGRASSSAEEKKLIEQHKEGAGIYFFALPTKAKNITIYPFSYNMKVEGKGVADDPKRSEINFKVQTEDIFKASDIYFNNKEDLSNELWTVYCVIIKPELWKVSFFFPYFVDYTYEEQNATLKERTFLSFFKKEDYMNKKEFAYISDYVRHVMSGNLTAKDYIKYHYDEEKNDIVKDGFDSDSDADTEAASVASTEGSESSSSDSDSDDEEVKIRMVEIDSKKLGIGKQQAGSNLRQRLPKGRQNDPINLINLIIAPSVIIDPKIEGTDENGNLVYNLNVQVSMTERHFAYGSIFFKYLNAIKRDWAIKVEDSVSREYLGNVGGQNDVKFIDTRTGIPLLLISSYKSANYRHLKDITVANPNIARLLFGSHRAWCKAPGNPKTMGYGCLLREVCEIATDHRKNSEMYSAYINGDNSDNTDSGKWNELIGRSSKELEEAIFSDASFYRASYGKNESYFRIVRDKYTARGGKEEDLKAKLMSIYKKVLGSFFDNIIKQICKFQPERGQAKQQGTEPYIEILQQPRLFGNRRNEAGELEKGMKAGKFENPDHSKLFYSVEKLIFNRVREADKEKKIIPSCQRPEGGLYLVCMQEYYEPKAEREGTTLDGKLLRSSKEKIFYSAKCPYGYVAKSLFERSRLVGSHLSFYLNVGIDLAGRKVNIVEPNGHSYSRTTKDVYFRSTPIQYFKAKSDDSGKKTKDEIEKEELRARMKNIPNNWFLYVHSKRLIARILEKFPGEKNYEERIFGIYLAVLFRKDLGPMKGIMKERNIYEILPYILLTDDKTKVLPDITESGNTLLNEKFPHIYENLVENCDEQYRAHRLRFIWKCYQEFQAFKTQSTMKLFSGDNIPLNIDCIHGYLFSEDFTAKSREKWPGLIKRDAYIAMTASVLLTERREVVKVSFIENEYINRGEKITSGIYSTADNEEAIRECENGKFQASIFANLADVPTYGLGLSNNIFVSTLEETLSPNTVNLFFTTRSMPFRLKGVEKNLRFYYIDGFMEKMSNTIQTGTAEFTNIPGGQVIIGGIKTPGVNTLGMPMLGSTSQNVEERDGNIRAGRNIAFIDRFRSILNARYRGANPKLADVSKIILEEATKDRETLAKLMPPNNAKSLIRGNIDHIFAELHMQLGSKINNEGKQEDNDTTARQHGEAIVEAWPE